MLSFFSESFFGDFPSCFCGFSEFYCLSLSSRRVFGDELCFRGWGFVVEFFSEEFTYSFYDDREGGNAARFFLLVFWEFSRCSLAATKFWPYPEFGFLSFCWN